MALDADLNWLGARIPLTQRAAAGQAGKGWQAHTLGDPSDAFDLPRPPMLAGIRVMVRRQRDFPPGIHLLPAEVERAAVANLE